MRLANISEIRATPDMLLAADAALLCNVRVGVWPIGSLHPADKHFSGEHPLLTQLTQALAADRTRHVTHHAQAWA
jgi:hypothetical protein